MVKYLAPCSLLFTSIVVINTSGCYSYVQYQATGGINGTSNIWQVHMKRSPDFFQVHQMQQEPDNPQAWNHECTDFRNNLLLFGQKMEDSVVFSEMFHV